LALVGGIGIQERTQARDGCVDQGLQLVSRGLSRGRSQLAGQGVTLSLGGLQPGHEGGHIAALGHGLHQAGDLSVEGIQPLRAGLFCGLRLMHLPDDVGDVLGHEDLVTQRAQHAVVEGRGRNAKLHAARFGSTVPMPRAPQPIMADDVERPAASRTLQKATQ
jgi:hypothetical protein